MRDRLTDSEQAAIIAARRERWGEAARLIDQAARLDWALERIIEREETRLERQHGGGAWPAAALDQIERLADLHQRALARLGRRQAAGPPQWAWGLPGWYDETDQRPASAHGDGWRPVTVLDDDDRQTLAQLRAGAPIGDDQPPGLITWG